MHTIVYGWLLICACVDMCMAMDIGGGYRLMVSIHSLFFYAILILPLLNHSCGIRLLRMYEYVVFVSRHTYVYAWLLCKVTCVCVVINYD